MVLMGMFTNVNTYPSTPTATKVLVLLFLCLPLVGCYQSDHEVIPAKMAEIMPYKSNTVSLGEDGDILLSRAPSSKDYAVRQTKKDDARVKVGTLRAMRIKGNIYAVQMKYDEDNSYDIVFCRINANNYEVLDPKSNDAVQALAKRYNVSLKDQTDLSGSPQDMLEFLKAHKDLEFEKIKQ
jgi:hypothetical protein